MKAKFRVVSFVLFVLTMSAAVVLVAQEPVIPFQAKIQRIQQVFGADGTLESEQIYTEDYMRSSSGSAYRESSIVDSINGQIKDPVKIIENIEGGRTYLINEGNKTVAITSSPNMLRKGQFRPPADLPRKEYLGRSCVVLSNPQQGGEVWIDPELDYLLYYRQEMSVDGNRKVVRIRRVTELTINKEPDPKLFMLPSFNGYEIFEK